MRQPGKHYFRTLFQFEFVDRNTVGQRLQRVPRRRFEVYDWYLRIFFKLLKNDFRIILITILQACERPDPDDIAIAANDRRRFFHMFGLVAIHDYTLFHFQSPTILAHIHRDHVQAKVLSSLLGADPRP
ncbi:hypothetical protein D3C87_1685000 [compost metagenome]